jgi:hypothetical protein
MNDFTFNPAPDCVTDIEWGFTRHDEQGVSYDSSLAIPESMAPQFVVLPEGAYKGLSKLAWQIRKLEAKRFGAPVMKVSWRRALWLAVLISGRRHNINSWLMLGVQQGFAKGYLAWC